MYVRCAFHSIRKILVDILFGIEKWNVKPPDVAKRYIDEIEHAQFFHAAISVKHPWHTVGRWTGHLLSTSSHVCIDLRGFIAAPPPTMSVVLTANVGSVTQGSLRFS